jgi:hypothetical protein
MGNSWVKVGLFGATCVGLLSFAVVAHAGTFEWSYAGSPCDNVAICGTPDVFPPRSDSGHGFLTTGGPIVTFGGVIGSQITSFTGTWNGLDITGLLPTDPSDPHYFFNNNAFFDPPGTTSFRIYLDFEGIGFSVSDGSAVNLFFIHSLYFAVSSDDPPYGYGSFTGQSFAETISFREVPGPIVGAGIPGLILACGGLLGWWRRRRAAASA